MIDLVADAFEFQNLCEKMNWRFCFIGGLALQVWGRQRLTRDIDLSLFTGFTDEDYFVDTILKHYRSRIPDAKDFAFKNRVLLLETKNNFGIDVALAGFPFESDVIERATYKRYTPEISLRTCSAEDLIILKAVASRGQDWVDIENVVIKQKELDWDYIEENMAAFSKLLYSRDSLERLLNLKQQFT